MIRQLFELNGLTHFKFSDDHVVESKLLRSIDGLASDRDLPPAETHTHDGFTYESAVVHHCYPVEVATAFSSIRGRYYFI